MRTIHLKTIEEIEKEIKRVIDHHTIERFPLGSMDHGFVSALQWVLGVDQEIKSEEKKNEPSASDKNK